MRYAVYIDQEKNSQFQMLRSNYIFDLICLNLSTVCTALFRVKANNDGVHIVCVFI